MRIAHLSDLHIAHLFESDMDDWIDYTQKYIWASLPVGVVSAKLITKLFRDEAQIIKLTELFGRFLDNGKTLDKRTMIPIVGGLFIGLGVLGYIFRREIMQMLLALRKDRVAAREALLESLEEQTIDHLVISGDLSNVAREEEFRKGREFIDRFLNGSPLARVTIVPGNHDVQDSQDGAINLQRFNKHFNEFLPSKGMFPIVQNSESGMIVGLGSITAGVGIGTEGKIDRRQMDAISKLFDCGKNLPKILTLHHHLKKKGIEPRMPPLLNGSQLLDIARASGVKLILHGHKHNMYHWFDKKAGITIACAGSSTKVTHLRAKTLEYRIFEFNDLNLTNPSGNIIKVSLQ